jgi:hypothetical protein
VRVKSELWAKAYLRTAAVHHCPGVIVCRGDADAGAIFIKVVRRDRTVCLYGPAPAGYDSGGPDEGGLERQWVPLLKGLAHPEATVDEALEQERRFDRDLWIIEIESPDGNPFLNGWLLATPL